jgi:ABC-type transport system substrate-binding protein
MEQAIRETNATVREELYYQIQKRFIEEIYPWSIIFVPKIIEFYRANLRGYASNFWNIVLKNAYFI